MKKIFLMLALIATAFAQQVIAQENEKAQPVDLLNAYYKLKDALVKSDPNLASASTDELIKAINSADKQTLDDDTRTALSKDAATISSSKDLKKQRESFASLSNNMVELAKKTKFTSEPVYQQYCPMKKASWLSNEKAVKNPYYGSAMLACGTVKSTF